ncbi:MAG: EAL domain-containing protein [Gammaproteobacteria bacterium]|uniref:EAL domain-containing protein n=1 Tax=Rhodoferax sp. TaxID=50421 RepID=UPI0017D1CE70|nr:EAL domain-containing protein [Rhodoferax sp.]MBU3899023.1 EAL domain-containing protein [Gammaproteobacteria bacterium]MBA3057677.1 EAL domain-containing protein [Rhodoferax sp.]MBU3998241.1 EAL domain-containing protein [Gammaproteobacteria bacterium]MBU4018466.1 EAL domain-containing protein [Gammaproteobacteria bacterium]MBU4080478.1 EAL domain-containing protein [Gammaproteobacteria bacterium]
MNLLHSRSLKTRVTLFTLGIFVLSIWLLAFYTSRMLRQDIQSLMGEQQFSSVAALATEIDDELSSRVHALEDLAQQIDPAMLADAPAFQRFLQARSTFQNLFNAGVFVTPIDGPARASTAFAADQGGTSGAAVDAISVALKQGQATVGQPVMGPTLQAPVFVIAAPIHNPKGIVIGALSGTINLALPNFLHQIKDSHYGKTGSYLLVSRPSRMVLTSTGNQRVTDALPASGVTPLIDRFMQGYEGSGVFTDSLNVERLASAKGLASADWYVAANLPTLEAFAPIRALQQRMLLAALLLTLVAGGLTWWMLRRQLAPLLVASETLASLAVGGHFPNALPVSRQDEIGQLIGGFNHLLERLRERDILLAQILDNSSVAIFLVDLTGRFTRVNQRMAEMFGTTIEQLLGSEYVNLIHPSEREIGRQLMLQLFASAVPSTDVERLYWRPDHTEFWGHLTGRRFFDSEGTDLGVVGVLEDITERKLAQAKISESEERFRTLIEESPSAIAVHRDGKMLYVNPAAIELLGASSAQELLDKSVLDLVHPDFRPTVLARIKHGTAVGGVAPLIDLKFLRLDGSVIDVESQGRVILYDGQPAIRAAFRDVTERKRAIAQLQLAASVYSHAREGIVITDAAGIILEVNEAFSRISGFSRDDVLGLDPYFLYSKRHGRAFHAAMRAELASKGHWYGEAWCERKDGEVYPVMLTISAVCDEHNQLQHYVSLFSDITAQKSHQHELEHIAHFDALTNLPNRVLLADRLQQAMAGAQRRSQRLAVAYLDLDGFKAINDRHGHEAGDLLLMTVAARMKQALREGDTLARIGGDEFVAVLLDLSDSQASVPMLRRVLAAAGEPVHLGELVLQVSASVGVTFYPQTDEVEADQLLRQADQAMYQAKLAGKNRYHFFDAEQDRSVRGHHESLEHIRLALDRREFVLYYQPKVNMRSGAVIGAEALIRWQHPEKGLLAPAQFLPVIEDHPLAVEVGEWVIATALSQIERWQAQGLSLPVSVNVGARQLQQIDFVASLREMLAAHPKLDPSLLEIEVLETSALEDLAGVSQVIEDCHQMGVLFAMDDFGTGYSSLTYLKRLRVTLLKIDQSFVRDMLDDPDDLAILQGVIGLAGAFRRDVIAEGVETIAHGTLLLQLGCDLAQGFGIARPMPADLMPAWAKAWQRDAAWVAVISS